jgi:Tol biopolymer transport system component
VNGGRLYFGGVPAGAGQLEQVFVAARSARLALTFAAPTVLPLQEALVGNPQVPATPGGAGTPWLSADELRLYFYVGPGLVGRELFQASRSALDQPFAAAVSLGPVNSPFIRDDHPWLSADELSLVFTSDRQAGVGTDLWRSQRTGRDQPFSAPVGIAELNSAAEDSSFSASLDGTVAVFMSRRNGNADIFMARRAPGAATFSPPQPIAAVNSGGGEYDPSISATGDELFFTSDRDGSIRIWRALRCPL